MYIGKFHRHYVAGICLSGITDDHISYIVKRMSDALIEKDFKVMIFNTVSDSYRDTPYVTGEESVFAAINYDMLDVLVILPESLKSCRICNAIIEKARDAEIPVIVADGRHDDCTNLIYDYESAVKSVTNHVIKEHGCTDLLFMSGIEGNQFSKGREKAFAEALYENGIDFDRDSMVIFGDFWEEPAEAAVDALIKSGRKLPQAIICANDSMALGVLHTLEEHSVKVPEDIIVTGLDAIYQNRVYSTLSLTTARMNADWLSEIVATTAQSCCDGTYEPGDILLPFDFIAGQSCGCGSFDSSYLNEMLKKMNDYNHSLGGTEKTMATLYSFATDKNTIEELTKTIGRYMNENSWLCLNSDYLQGFDDEKSYHDVFTEKMNAVIVRNGNEYRYNEEYASDKILPDLNVALKKFNKLIFMPIHSQDRCGGYYCAAADKESQTPSSFYYMQRLVVTVNQILESFRSNYHLMAINDELSRTHSIDPLTGIYNRRGYFDRIEKLLEESTPVDMMVISCDMDDLKPINDTYGHAEGDEAIMVVADAIRSVCGLNGICARFGGDEFLYTMPVCAKERCIAPVMGLIQSYIDKFNHTAGKPYSVSISSGGAVGTVSGTDDVNELIRRSDRLMYEQKRFKKAGHTAPESTDSEMPAGGSHLEYYDARMHHVFSLHETTTYFYMNYADVKWLVKQNRSTPKCLISPVVGPLRALWVSNDIHPEDRAIFNIFAQKVREAYRKTIVESRIEVNIRLRSNDDSESYDWYLVSVSLGGNDEGKLTEMAGYVQKMSPDQIFKMEILDNYHTSDKPEMLYDIMMTKLKNNKDKKYALIQFDIKHFKFINEKYGEEEGTALLHYIARQLKMCCGDAQISARLSADVFILLTPYEKRSDIIDMISWIQTQLKSFNDYNCEFVFGVYLITDISASPRAMCDYAAEARTSIKNNALENIAFYDDGMRTIVNERTFVETNMKHALENSEFIIYLQPQFSLSQNRAIGYETLVRWQSPEKGMIYPDSFIPLFEENGFILKMDAYVWECACIVLRDWIDRNLIPLPLSVNVSRANLRNEKFLETLESLTQKYRIPKALLPLEITENIETVHTQNMTEAIKEHGFTLMMDDFGSGYSSLNMLQNTHFDAIKIDRKFFSAYMSNERGKKIIRHTVSMTKDIGLDIIAEGVETPMQADFLKGCSCDIVQGFLFARPMTVQEAERFLMKSDENVGEKIRTELQPK